MIENSEDENCNKNLIQNDVGPSQNKSDDKHKTHSLDECAENIMKGLRAIPKHLNINTKKTLDVQFETQFFFHETFNTTKPQIKCQSLCLCSQKNIWDSKKNVIDINSWKIYDHCKKHHELYLNYNSEYNS